MTARERELLAWIASREPFVHDDPTDAGAGERFDALCRELQGLERRGWISLTLQRNYLTGYGHWYSAVASLTKDGHDAVG